MYVFLIYAGSPNGRQCLTLWFMKDQRLTLRISSETRARLRCVANGYGLTESALVMQLIDRTVDPVPSPPADAGQYVRDAARAERLSVRLYQDDRQLLAERATARGMPSATYVSVLTRAHLRRLAPLPTAELQEFGKCVAQLSAMGRNLNQIARRVNQDGVVSSISRTDLALFLKTCTRAVSYFKSILKANKYSWEVGYETSDR